MAEVHQNIEVAISNEVVVEAAPMAGRDSSVFPANNNLLTVII